MIYMIRHKKRGNYYSRNLGFMIHWTHREDGKEFFTLRSVKDTIRRNKLKNVEVIEL